MGIDFSKYPWPKRLRHHTSSNLYLPLCELKTKPKNYPPLYEQIDWGKLFLNGHEPDMLDIGCGKGAFLFKYALKYPDKNILGIELRKEPVNWISQIIEGEKIANCAVSWYSVANGLPFINEISIERIFYLFPDPWHKRKHHKRSVFNMDFLEEVYRVLTNDGIMYLATDVPEVDDYHKAVLSEFKKFEYKFIDEYEEWDLPVTNKEEFCIKKNIPYTRIICRKY